MLKISTRNPSKNNTELSLLRSLKALGSPFRILKLPELIKHCSLNDNQLISVLYLFPNENRFAACKLLVEHLKINLAILTDSERGTLTVCLSQDPFFSRLLPFQKKNFGISSYTNTIKNNSQIPRLNQIKSTQQVFKPVIKKYQEFSIKNKQNNIQLPTLQALRLSLIKEDPALRLRFFKSLITNTEFYQTVFKRMNVEEFKNFIEIFPPNDAIKFLNLSFIQKSLQQQNDPLSKESFIDLLNYFKPYQHDSVMKLLRPISANIDKKWVQQGIFKEKNISKEELNLPDVIASCNKRK